MVNEDATSSEKKLTESPQNLSDHKSIGAKPIIPDSDEKDSEPEYPTHSTDEQRKTNSEFDTKLIELVECENIEKAVSPEAIKNQETDLLLSGATNGEILEHFNELNQKHESCKQFNLDENRKTSHDLAMERFLSGEVRGLYYLTSFILPVNFDTYSEAEKNEYRNYIGELLNEQVVRCEKLAIKIYANNIGEGTYWSQKNTNMSDDLVTYEKKLLLDFLYRMGGFDETENIELMELSSKLSPEEIELVGEKTEIIFKNCFESKSSS